MHGIATNHLLHRETVDSVLAEILAVSCSAALGRPMSQPELEHMVKYLEIILKWQKSQRLIASDDPAWIARALVADSLLFLKVLPQGVKRIVDIGSGAGFPGIPIKIVTPEVAVTLLESRQRRASFLKAVVRELALTGVDVIDRRLESVAFDLAGVFDAAVMRCAGDPGRLLPLVLPLLRHGGAAVASGRPAPSVAKDSTVHTGTGVGLVVVRGVEGRPRTFLVAQKS